MVKEYPVEKVTLLTVTKIRGQCKHFPVVAPSSREMPTAITSGELFNLSAEFFIGELAARHNQTNHEIILDDLRIFSLFALQKTLQEPPSMRSSHAAL
jgi:hypothetical protein